MSNPFDETLRQAESPMAPAPGGSVRSDSAAKRKARRDLNGDDADQPEGFVTIAHEMTLNWLRTGDENFGLVSCYVNGKPSALVVAARRAGDKRIEFIPLFVALCEGMRITDPDGDVIHEGLPR